MKIKQCPVIIKLSDNTDAIVGTAQIEIALDWDDIYRKQVPVKATLKKLDINIKKGNILWEK